MAKHQSMKFIRWVAALLWGVFLTLNMSSCGTNPPQPCSQDWDCLITHACVGGLCQRRCRSDADCPNALHCRTITGHCISLDEGPVDSEPSNDAGATAQCGNAVVDPGEACDGSNLHGHTCKSLGFPFGTLSCTRHCQLDASQCSHTSPSQCGNGAIDPGEQCDGSLLQDQTCQSKGFTGGTLQCTPTCTFDTSQCTQQPGARCGNNIAEGDEECDGPDLRGKSCKTWGFLGGRLTCKSNCVFDASGCTRPPKDKCGDGKAEAQEECDGQDLRGQSCQSKGFTGGKLQCSPACKLETSQCTRTNPGLNPNFGLPCPSGGCGAGLLCHTFSDGKQFCTAQCDNNNPCPKIGPPAQCGLALSSGAKACRWDSKSGAPPVCGDKSVSNGEDCEPGSDLWTTCKGLGYSGGTLKCSNRCVHDTSGCTGSTTCPSLPQHWCSQDCKALVRFLPRSGPGYKVFHYDKWTWVRRDVMHYFKYAAASVACLMPGSHPIGIGDISDSRGGTPRDSDGSLRHPGGSHDTGRDMDVAYYQTGTADNDLRPVCPHANNHCTGTPNTLDAPRSALLLAKLLESGQVRIVGVDGKIGPILKKEIDTLYQNGIIAKRIYNLFNSKVTWETRNTGQGWYYFHHHHFHISHPR